MSSNADHSSLFEPLSVTKFDDTGDLFALRSFLGGDAEDEASLLDSFDAEESFFDLPEDVIADLEPIPEIDECPEQAMSPAPMSDLTRSVKRLSISHLSSTTFETALDTFSDSTSTFVATSRTFSTSSSSSSSSSQEGFHISESFAECMRKSSESRQQLNLWQKQVRSNSTTTSTERKRSHSTIEESTTTLSAATSVVSTPSTALPTSGATTATTDVSSSLEAATPPFPKRQARPETVMCTAQFLCGSRPTLTAALEQSRQALKEYMVRARCA